MIRLDRADLLFTTFFLLWFAVYFQVLSDMMGVWLGSETYSYCFFIFPISVYLIYEKREQLALIPTNFNHWLLVLLLLGQIVFLLSDLAGIGVLMHLSAYGSLVCIVGITYGLKILKFLMFPLGYLVLSVPMGEELVPVLQNITADISVWLVELVGIPVYREGLYIYISNGTFEVAEACSGIRFLITMVAIGTLYAYLYYHSIWRRLVFIGLSLVIPIIANGIRAFGIIYVGHKTDMEHAVGTDHLVYGWIFFSIVLILLMAIGKFWQEDVTDNNKNDMIASTMMKPSLSASMGLLCLTLSILTFKPLYESLVVGQDRQVMPENKFYTFLKANIKQGFMVSFGPRFDKADKKYQVELQGENTILEIYVAKFDADTKERELINWGNRIYDIDKLSMMTKQPLTIKTQSGVIDATLLKLVTLNGHKANLVYWYETEGIRSSDKLVIKKTQLLNKLSGGSGGGAVVILSIDNKLSDLELIKRLGESLSWL